MVERVVAVHFILNFRQRWYVRLLALAARFHLMSHESAQRCMMRLVRENTVEMVDVGPMRHAVIDSATGDEYYLPEGSTRRDAVDLVKKLRERHQRDE